MSIATEISRLQSAKADIKTAIEGKGVTVPSSTKLDGYATLIDSIETGGGGYTVEQIADGSVPVGDVVLDDSATSIGSYCLSGRRNMTSLTGNVTSVGYQALGACANLVSVDFPNATAIPGYLFSGCSNLAHVNMPSATQFTGPKPFNNCPKLKSIFLNSIKNKANSSDNIFTGSSLETVVMPSFTTWSFNGFINSAITVLDLGKKVTSFGGSMLQSSNHLSTLIVRKTSGVPSLTNINCFSNTPFASGKAGGTLYVPNDLIASYQSASNWSTILGYANNQILPIEGSIYETQYADGTPIE